MTAPEIINSTAESVDVTKLTPHPENPNRGDVDAIVASIEANGFYGVVVAQKSTGYVLAGNHRVEAARSLGMPEVPVIWVDVDDDRARRILLADNRTAELAYRDEEALAELLGSLDDDLIGTGYDDDDLDELLSKLAASDDVDVSPQLGDLRYRIVIECDDEMEQIDMIDKLSKLEIEFITQII